MNVDHDFCCEVCLGREQSLVDAAVSVLQLHAENRGAIDDELVELAGDMLKNKLKAAKMPNIHGTAN